MTARVANPKKPMPPKGSAAAHRAKVSKITEALVASTGQTPLNYLLEIMRNPAMAADMRMDAAKAAAPYVHPKLASIEHKGQIELGFAEKLVKARERLGKS